MVEDQNKITVTMERLGVMLLGLDALVLQLVAPGKVGQAARILVILVFGRDIPQLEEALELDNRSGRAEGIGLAVASFDCRVSAARWAAASPRSEAIKDSSAVTL